ncbi:AAA family ATPase [Synechocystis sp. LEGE 06083]|uniref:AAA family ATPase n=1 Tax=Synechocystis sp. LEGE 06083 TaxID=915336 RepID=UPI00187EB924|nr:AAA family ATPase [Synechocystis sp. LEGE 06083]MBE9196750.1 AAA family ATPase [Synechocystis sp. LEGE 06083]
MFFKELIIENVGPISNLKLEFPKNNQNPKPLIVVGENGSGKSILLSYLVNALIAGKQLVYDDVEVEKGKVFKYRSPQYIRVGEHYSRTVIEFDSGEKVEEWQLSLSKNQFEDQLKFTPLHKEWNQIPSDEYSFFQSSFKAEAEGTKLIFKNQCCLYFPVNRFEDPAWLNIDNLQSKATYTELKNISGYSNRNLICMSPLRNNINWLLDVILDRQTLELRTREAQWITEGKPNGFVSVLEGFFGQSSNIYNAINQVLAIILRQEENIRIGLGDRHHRQISLVKNGRIWIPNLFQLSTGEVQLINLFLSIIRDYDLSEGQLNDLNDIRGIVIIDEIDSHLHTLHQREILPEIIKLLPSIQFIITTHSPLFLIGMDEKLGKNGFEVINMPTGEKIYPTDFSEFGAAYDTFKTTAIHRKEIEKQIENHSKPIVFVEGDHDVHYLEKAAELLNQSNILNRVQLDDGGGFGGLDKIWKAYNNPISEVLPNKVILLYDCDTNKQKSQNNKVYKEIIPLIKNHPISIGIENLFPPETIDKIEKQNPQYIDLHSTISLRERGKTIEKPAYKSVNKDEKSNMCRWLCENGDAQDFSHFLTVFEIIETIINE